MVHSTGVWWRPTLGGRLQLRLLRLLRLRLLRLPWLWLLLWRLRLLTALG